MGIIRKALFSDTTNAYATPFQPKSGEKVVLKVRTACNNVSQVALLRVSDKTREVIERHECVFERKTEHFDYYKCEVIMDSEPFLYCFEIAEEYETVYVMRYQVLEQIDFKWLFKLIPDFYVPEWAMGVCMYQIYVDRFACGNPNNNVQNCEYKYLGQEVHHVDDWNAFPEAMDVFNFYGGDLVGVKDKLPYLQELGVQAIYFNPIFVSPSNHKYDCQDYDYIDPHLCYIPYDVRHVTDENRHDNMVADVYITRTTDQRNLDAANAFFEGFVEKTHQIGMKIVIDGVFNHCGSFHKWLDRERIYENKPGYAPGAYTSAMSPYRSYFSFFNQSRWPYNGSYEGWWGHDTLPKLNYDESEDLWNYILGIGKKWVSEPFNVDGWRLDVAADLGHSQEVNHAFWKDFRKSVRASNKEALIIAEHYGDVSPWLKGDEWDSVMNYDAFMEPVTYFLTGMEKHSDEYREDLLNNSGYFVYVMQENMARFTEPSLFAAMNELSNHDHSRFLTRTNHKVGRVAELGSDAATEDINEAVFAESCVMLFTLPGAPTIYYGDEAGVCGFTDPDNRRTYPWGNENKKLINLHKELIRIHKAYDTLKKGSFKFLNCAYGFVSYARFDEKAQFVVAVNNLGEGREVEIDAWQAGVESEKMVTLFTTGTENYSPEAKIWHLERGKLKFYIGPYSAIIMKNLNF